MKSILSTLKKSFKYNGNTWRVNVVEGRKSVRIEYICKKTNQVMPMACTDSMDEAVLTANTNVNILLKYC